MTVTHHSGVVVAPQTEWNELRAFFGSQGFELGDGQPASADGSEPATHLYAHMWLTATQAQTFTLRATPSRFLNGYTLAEAQAALEQFRTRNNGNEINFGSTPDGSRPAHLRLNTDSGARLTARPFFEFVASAASVVPITPQELESLSVARSGRKAHG